MAGFEKKIVDPLAGKAQAKIDAALKIEDITLRTDGLVIAREENDAAFAKVARRQGFKMFASCLLAVTGLAGGAGGLMAATSLVAVLAGTTGFAIPLAIAGAVVFGAGAALLQVSGSGYSRLQTVRDSLNNKAEVALAKLAEAYPQETAKSSRFAAFLKNTFNPAAAERAPQATFISALLPAKPVAGNKP